MKFYGPEPCNCKSSRCYTWYFVQVKGRTIISSISSYDGYRACCSLLNDKCRKFETFEAAVNYIVESLSSLGYKHLEDHFKALL